MAIPALIGVFIGLILLISGPSMILAYMKLRKRNLGPILDANGWAVNSKAKVNVPFGKSLTQVAALPPGSQRDLVDPFAEKKSPWPKIIVVLVILAVIGGCWYYGKLDELLPAKVTSLNVLGTNAPAYVRRPTNAVPPSGFNQLCRRQRQLLNIRSDKPGRSRPGFLFFRRSDKIISMPRETTAAKI